MGSLLFLREAKIRGTKKVEGRLEAGAKILWKTKPPQGWLKGELPRLTSLKVFDLPV